MTIIDEIRCNIPLQQWTSNKKLIDWVTENLEQCQPSYLHLCEGSQGERDRLFQQMEKNHY